MINIPNCDVLRLAEIYERIPHEKLNLSAEEFVADLSHRFYEEWCLENEFREKTQPGYKPKKHYDYKGEEFLDFIRDETHYEIKRRGLVWQHISSGDYEYIRTQVLTGLVKKAIFLFSEWGNSHPKNKSDTRNLRGDLKDFIYLEFRIAD